MNRRRTFLQWAGAAAAPIALGGVAQADDGSVKQILGAWMTVHALPFPPGSFREFLSFSDGGVLQETNSFLHTNSNLDFSAFGLPNVVNASDGMGNWERVANGQFRIIFRKMLFDGSRQNFGDLKVTGLARTDGMTLAVDWVIQVVNLTGQVIFVFGNATSQGTRIIN